MAAAQGTVLYHQQDHALTVRVEGRATMTHGLPVRRLAERSLERGATHLRFDLRDCTYMDSTFLGTLLTLKKAVDRAGGRLTLLTPSPACLRILHQMGLTDVLPAQVEGLDPQVSWTELACEANDPAFRRNVVQAHEELAALPGPAGEQFKAVVRCMGQPEPPASPRPADPSQRPSE
jgi:anti-anti-sigma factor